MSIYGRLNEMTKKILQHFNKGKTLVLKGYEISAGTLTEIHGPWVETLENAVALSPRIQ